MVDGHDDGTASQRGQGADDEGASVAALHPHALAIAHAELGELAAHRFDLAPERLVIHRAGGIDDGYAVRPLASGVGEGVVNVHSECNPNPARVAGELFRSEEHTSELQ